MSGRFNPFQSKQQEVFRPHFVADAGKARKLLAKCQKKRPCVWAEVTSLETPEASTVIEGLNGETSVVLFLNTGGPTPVPSPLPPVLDALVGRLWNNFNKLYLALLGTGDAGTGAAEEN